ncbi:C40 family peptidase [Streptomyces sp. NPDC004539]|uniref:C40 family peptidase n=1 Tax=Streptomyces sp. NPDC004539 TaxID=3154280 RepID=UPI0033B7350A
MASHQRRLRWTGMRASGVSAPALATAAVTSMAMFTQPAEAVPDAADGRPALEDVEAKLDAFYSSQTGSKKDTAAKEKETKRAKTFLDTAARYRTQEPLLPPPPALPPLPSFPPSVAHDFTAAPDTHEQAPRSSDRIPDSYDAVVPLPSAPPEFPEAAPLLAAPASAPQALPADDPDGDPEGGLKGAKSIVQGKLSKAQALLSFHTANQPKAAPRQQEAAPVSAEAERALAFAREQLGKPVVLGAAGPGSFDGPGLTQTAWKSAGVGLPRTAFGQVTAGKPIRLPDARPGDLVFFHDDITHVGIYTGDGLMIHAPRPGAYVCEESIHFAGTSEIHSVVRPA